MALEKQVLTPSVIWYQTKNEVFFNIELQNIKDEKIIINEHNFSMYGISGNDSYEMNFDFFDLIDTEKSNCIIQEKCIKISLFKKEENKWTYLTKNKLTYKNNIKVNWNSWVDEEVEDEPEENPMAGFDMQQMMASMGGGGRGMPDFSSMMGGMGGSGGEMPDFSSMMGGMGEDIEGMPDFNGEDEDDDEENDSSTDCENSCIVEGHNHEEDVIEV
jgi:hypothetical protein